MDDAATATTFAGIDRQTPADLPTWFDAEHDDPDHEPFASAIRQLPRATTTDVAYRNPYTDEWIETERHNAVVEPTRLAGQASDDNERSPLFNVPTDSYSVINPTEVYSPLADLLREETYDGHTLGELAFGEIRQYRGGGEVHMDIMFDGLDVSLPGERDPITMGVTTGYDFFGGTAVYVEGFARDTACANSIRGLTDRQAIKHVGDVEEFRSWWAEVLGQLELVAHDLHGFIADAQEIDLAFTDLPFGVERFYELLGFPAYLAEHAAQDARANAADPTTIDMWTLHSGATYALTHFFRGKEGDALRRYTRLANDVLFNPEATIGRVERAYGQAVEAEQENGSGDGERGDQHSLERVAGLASVEQVSETVRDRAEQFEAREQQLRERFEHVADD